MCYATGGGPEAKCVVLPERNDGGGHLEITDPPVVEQKSGNAPAIGEHQ